MAVPKHPDFGEDAALRFLQCYEQLISSLPESQLQAITSARGAGLTSEQRRRRIAALLYALGHELEGLKRNYPNDLSLLRDSIAPEDLGYVTTFLENSFKDDRLIRWFNSTPYHFVGPPVAKK